MLLRSGSSFVPEGFGTIKIEDTTFASFHFGSMASLRRILQEVWKRSHGQWVSMNRVEVGGKTLVDSGPKCSRQDTSSRSGLSLSSASFLKPYDDWAALQSSECASFSQIIEAEKSATSSFFARAGPSRRDRSGQTEAVDLVRLQDEAASLLPSEDVIPELQGQYMYFQRHTLDGFVQFCRHPENQPQAEEVILDTSMLAKETGFADVTACKVSDDHELLAYIVDFTGDDSLELRLQPLGTCAFAETISVPSIRSVEFLGKSENVVNLLAVRTDPTTKRANHVLHLTVTDEHVSERVLWNEPNPAAYLELFRTKNRKLILASSNTKDTSLVCFAPCGKPKEVELTTLLKSIPGVEFFAEHQQDIFIVISNHERPDFAVYTLPEEQVVGSGENWSKLKHFFSPPGEMHVTDADLLSGYLILYGHEAAAPRICVVPMKDPKSSYMIDLPRIGSLEPGVNADHTATTTRFTLRSPVEPGCTFDLDLSKGITTMVGKRQLDGNSALSSFMESVECERVDFKARDGERVPMTLLRPRELPGHPAHPCLLHVYGAYGSSMTPDFRPEHLMMLRRGWVIAWAHVRGGGERGRAWHQAGRQLQKSRSVLDLSDAVRFLLAQGIAAPGGLCLKGSSAGALTLGSLLNSREDAALIGSAILEVPFLDVLNSMADPLLPLTTHEFAEWGDPRNLEHEMNIRSLSPYENIGSHPYPHIYVSCALADARAPAWMAVKYAARLRCRTPAYMSKIVGHSLSLFTQGTLSGSLKYCHHFKGFLNTNQFHPISIHTEATPQHAVHHVNSP